MKNDHYQFPEAYKEEPARTRTLHEESLSEALRIAASYQQLTPEIQPRPYQYIKEIEARIESYRETATATEMRKTPWRRVLRPYILTPKSPLERLVDQEAFIGGALFQKRPDTVSQRFWYHNEYRGKGDWFFESTDTNKHTIVIQFQTTASSVEKLVNGVPQPMHDDEAALIAHAPELYEKAVLKQLYPVDAFLHETAIEEFRDRSAA